MEEQLVEGRGDPIGHHPRTALHNGVQPLDHFAGRNRSGIAIPPVVQYLNTKEASYTTLIFSTRDDEQEEKLEDQKFDAVLLLHRKRRERLQQHQALRIVGPTWRQNLCRLDVKA